MLRLRRGQGKKFRKLVGIGAKRTHSRIRQPAGCVFAEEWVIYTFHSRRGIGSHLSGPEGHDIRVQRLKQQLQVTNGNAGGRQTIEFLRRKWKHN